MALVGIAAGLILLSGYSMDGLRQIRKTSGSERAFDYVRMDLPLSAFAFGHGGTIASAWWVTGLLELADDILFQGGGLRLPRLIRTTSLLDPRWKEPFNLALIIEDSLGRPRRETIELLVEAVRLHPEAWRFRPYLAVSLLRFPGLGMQERIDSAATVLQALETSRDLSIPEHIRNLGKAMRSGEKAALADLMLESYFAEGPVNRSRFRIELVSLLQRQTGLPHDFVTDFLTGLDALSHGGRAGFASVSFLTSPKGRGFVESFRKYRLEAAGVTTPESESSKSP